MTTQPTPQTRVALKRPGGLHISKSTGRRIRLAITYILLISGAVTMIFPLLWMFGASFKPEWQILTTPPIWIPSKWLQVSAGNTIKELPLWYATDTQGKRERGFDIGTRRYTTVVDVSQLAGKLSSVSPSDVGAAAAKTVNGVLLNVRQGKNGQQVVALAKDGDNLVIASADAVAVASQRMPLDLVNAGKKTNVTVDTFKFQGSQLSTQNNTVVKLGPESQLTVIAPQATASSIFLVKPDDLSDPQFIPIGHTELQFYALKNQPADQRYLKVGQETWQLVMDLNEMLAHGYVVPSDSLTGTPEARLFQFASLPVYKLPQPDGTQQEVILLDQAGPNSYVIPAAEATTIHLSPLEKLAYPFLKNVGGVSIPYLDDYFEHGKKVSIAIIGQKVDLALVAPQSSISNAFDVNTKSLKRVLKISFRYQNYVEALGQDVGGATFLTFYKNSLIVVALNLLGVYFSVTLVAYGFARLQAPGKNALFLLLLSTMMIPFPVLLIPTYEIFRALGMLNTLWPLFIRSFFASAFFVFLLRQFFMSIPRELEEAARIDGANTLQVLWSVMLPLSKPALMTIGIFTFWWNWNSFFEPFVYVGNIKDFTVTLGLAFFKNQYVYTYRWLMAAGMASILPIIVLFFFAQRYFIEGIQLTGLKG